MSASFVIIYCLVMTSALGTFGLHFHMNVTSLDLCGQLTCSLSTNQTDEKIFSITDVTIFDITRPKHTVKLASASAHDSEVYVDDVRRIVMNVCGTVSQFHANLNINFMQESYCQLSAYLCEIRFINTDGHTETVQATVTPNVRDYHSENNDLSEYALASSSRAEMNRHLTHNIKQLVDATERLSNRTDEHEQSLVELTNRLTVVETLLTNFNMSKDIQEKHEQTKCYKGMASVTGPPRIPVQVLDSRQALCDTMTDGGGWIVIQRRVDGDVDFYRDWEDYKHGFGNVSTDYWLGNQAVHTLTTGGNFELRFDMMFNGAKYYAQYSSFVLGSEISNYKLHVGTYSGNVKDSLTGHHNNMPFSTYDKENDNDSARICAVVFHGAWWYNACHHSNLNGKWMGEDYEGLDWYYLTKGSSVSFSEMKIRLV